MLQIIQSYSYIIYLKDKNGAKGQHYRVYRDVRRICTVKSTRIQKLCSDRSSLLLEVQSKTKKIQKKVSQTNSRKMFSRVRK